MSTPLSFDVHDFLDALNDSVGLRAGELIGSVGVWFANKFNDQSAEEKHDTMLRVRPVLRRHGFDICDSELQEPVGCDFCEDFNQYGYGSFRYALESCAVFRLRAPSYGFDGEMDFRVRLADYEYGFNVPVNYCPMCGRRLDAAEEG